MEIKYGSIVLRDYREQDIEDWIRWNTVETQWVFWDTPDQALPEFDPAEYRTDRMAMLKAWEVSPPEGFRWVLEADNGRGEHIGVVNAYLTDENWQWVPYWEHTPGQKVHHVLGLEVFEPRNWNHGYGTQMLAAYIRYHLAHGYDELWLQTWSGNVRMIRCAQKLGFVEQLRESSAIRVDDAYYDALTFRLDTSAFRAYPQVGL